jgi:hypothetical protein
LHRLDFILSQRRYEYLLPEQVGCSVIPLACYRGKVVLPIVIRRLDTQNMDRRSFVGTIASGLLVAHPLCRGQAVATIRRIGWLTLGSEASVAYLLATLKHGMHDLGWQEGKNIEYRIVYAST